MFPVVGSPARALRTALAAALLLPLATAARAVCPGDCDGGGTVVINELVRGVAIALGNAPVADCAAFDANGDETVAVNELIAAVNAALGGCPIEPLFPADYRSRFTVVRDCRLGIEHSGAMVRVYANAAAAQPYLDLENPLPVGSVVVKEEFNGVDCDNDAELVRWAAMRKEAPGFDAEDGDWHWQRVEAPSRRVVCDDKRCPGFSCIGCHRDEACLARDYMCTEGDGPPRGTLRPVLQDLPAALLSVSGSAATDVYAVGADPGDGLGPFVLHYDGARWRRLESGATGDLWWIAVAPVDGDFYMAGDAGLILQYDPASGAFTRHATPGTERIYGIWGTAADRLWAVGGDENAPDTGGVVWRFDGASWTVQDLSAVRPEGVPTLFKVWGRAADDVYAVGARGVVLHFDGAAWSALDSGTSRALFTVHGTGALLDAVGGFFAEGIIVEDAGSGFARVTPPGAPQLNGVFLPPDGRGVAVGTGLAVAVRTTSGWQLRDEGSDERLRDFHAVWIDPEDGIWAVGGDLSLDLIDGVLAYGGTRSIPTALTGR